MIGAFIIYVVVSLIMTGLGISQLKSREPVGFYSGEKRLRADEVADVSAWNRKHGLMWCIYGLVIFLSGIAGIIIGDSIYCVFPMFGGVTIPLGMMIWYHHRLLKMYKK